MIDIHNHMLFGVDDGSKSLEESIRLLKEAKLEGIDEIILTPHYFKDGNYKIESKYLDRIIGPFINAVLNNGIDIKFHLGNELYIDENLDDLLDSKRVKTLANSKYILVEFPFTEYSNNYDEYLYNLSISGYKVIIAHPERYKYVKEDVNFVERWTREGYLLQVNQNSLFNKDTKHIVFKLIDKGYVYFIGSDAHNEYRKCTLIEAYELIKKKYNINLANRLFNDNQRCVIDNKSIEVMPKFKKKFLGIF